MARRETIVELDETPDAAENQARPGVAKWKGRASTKSGSSADGGAIYGLGMIGALVYFLGTAQSGREYVLAFGKALVWPALLVYRAFKFLGG
jgi:hypothetical protein